MLFRARWVEAALLVPLTLVLGSALPFGVFTLVVEKFDSYAAWLALFDLLVAAISAVTALWFTVLLGTNWAVRGSGRRFVIAASLFAGMIAIVDWMRRLNVPPHNASTRKALVTWCIVLAGPIVMAIRNLYLILVRRT